MSHNQQTTTSQPIASTSPLDPRPLVEHGTEPVSIILAIAILISILFRSITGLIRIILILMLRQTKSSTHL